MNKTIKQLLMSALLVTPIAAFADSCLTNGGNAGGAGAGMTCFSPPPSSCSTDIGSAAGGAGAGKICFAAPEIDTASTASALALLTGGLLVLRGRKSGR